MTPRFTPVLFDLDGTIVDSAPGILASLAWTYEQLRMPIPAPAELLKWVGPPILDSFRDLAKLDEDESRYALALYREHYAEVGVLDATPYPGVLDVLRDIREAGVPLSLATSKPESLARTILDHIGIADAFTEITGASEDEVRSSKPDVVAEALRRLAADGDAAPAPVMVGDRIHDVEGAAEHEVPTIFVTWGYGSPAEAAGAIAVARTSRELLAELAL
ncbi:MAG: HAD hydrolase-like protein [Micrococcales bacterium]|nr:HAD hydrolase-like protein [Micrococcales bacterium]OJX67698.1 MAG: haloacid dehalogenase [Micrococcales bacterium 72-143]